MARLLESLESESQPEAYLPEDLQYWLKDYMRFFQSMDGDDNDLDAIFNKLIAFCHPQGQRHPTRFVNHSLLTFEYDNQNGCADGSLVARGRFLGTVSKVFEPLYSCNDTKAVLNGTKHWFFATERWFATEWFARRLQLEWSPFDGNRYDLSNLWTVFAETLLSSAKLTENGLERLGIQDNAHLATWLWRVVWKADPAQQTYHFQKMYHRLKDILLQMPFLDTEISDPGLRNHIQLLCDFLSLNGRFSLRTTAELVWGQYQCKNRTRYTSFLVGKCPLSSAESLTKTRHSAWWVNAIFMDVWMDRWVCQAKGVFRTIGIISNIGTGDYMG
uniref:Uncharacterized protein n=1 Tax=Bionectria ochroleuca TaxID=29856 RepID=A0A8H7N1J4_BIOOC